MGREWGHFYKECHLSSAADGTVMVSWHHCGALGEIISFHAQPEGDRLFPLTEAKIQALVDKVTSQITHLQVLPLRFEFVLG